MTGRISDVNVYAATVTGNRAPARSIDDVNVHVDGNTAVVSARTHWGEPGTFRRYADTRERRDGRWVCSHASVWRLSPESPG